MGCREQQGPCLGQSLTSPMRSGRQGQALGEEKGDSVSHLLGAGMIVLHQLGSPRSLPFYSESDQGAPGSLRKSFGVTLYLALNHLKLCGEMEYNAVLFLTIHGGE